MITWADIWLVPLSLVAALAFMWFYSPMSTTCYNWLMSQLSTTKG